MANYDSIDLEFTWDGDYILGDDGDLKDTSEDYLQSVKNEIHSVLRSELNDWEVSPTFAASISEFRGEPNNEATARAIEERVRSRISDLGLVKQSDLAVRVVPVGIHQVMIVLTINATSTPGNSLNLGEALGITFLYDTLEDSVFYLEDSKQEKEYRTA